MKPPFFPWKKEWTGCIIIVLGLRVFYSLIGFWVVSSGGPIPLQATAYGLIKPFLKNDLISAFFVNPWYGWDTILYLKIAILGYGRDSTVAFMPLYPLLIRILTPLLAGNYLLAALVISTLCAIAVLILMLELFRKYNTSEVAWRTVLLFVSFPTFFFLLSGYTEALFLLLVIAFWILARQQYWLGAGIFAGLATLTRLQGVILSVVMLWMMMVSLIERPATNPILQVRQVFSLFKPVSMKQIRKLGVVSWLALSIPLLVAECYQAWLKFAGFGSIAGALRSYWKLETVAPWTGFLLFLQRLPTRHFNYMDWIDLVLLLLIFVAAIIGLRRLDPAFSLYVWLTLAVLFTRGTPPHLLASYSRYFLGLFPLFVLPVLSHSRFLSSGLVVLFFFFQVLLVSIFLWGSWVA